MKNKSHFPSIMYTITLMIFLVSAVNSEPLEFNKSTESEVLRADSTGQVQPSEQEKDFSTLTRLSYNNPDITVDLGVGLWATPFPVDFDEDGQNDLLLGSGGRPYNGIYLFEGTTDEKGPLVFEKGKRLSASTASYNMQISHLEDSWVITQPGKAYPDYKNTFLENPVEIPFDPEFYIGRANQWKYFDYNGDGATDLIIGASDWRDYRWDDAYTKEGKWVNGPLRAFIYWMENKGTDENPDYAEPKKVMAGDEPVEVYGMPSPNFADFDGDGLPDLMLGEFLDKFTFFKNIGTRTNPKYAPGKLLKNNGNVVKMDLEMITPSALDWDKDGNVDLIVGDEDGRVAFVRNTGRIVNDVPVFEDPVYFKQKADEVKIGALATPFAYDWNGDGNQDIIAGNTAGYLLFVENLGGYPPKWAAPEYLEADGDVIRILAGENGSIQGPAEAKWGYTVLSVADWNGNGLPDIIINSILGKIMWYENIGTRSKPKLAAAKPVQVEWQRANPKPAWFWWEPVGKDLVTQWRSTPQAIDLNEDGLTDLVGLDQEGFLAFYERKKVNGELKLMPPKRIFYADKGVPSVYESGHHAIEIGTVGHPEDLVSYNEEGDLAYLARARRPVSPMTISTIFRVPGIKEYMNDSGKDLDRKPLRLNAGWAGSSGRRKFHLVDWTGDGKLDLIINSGTNADLMENVAENPGEFIFHGRGRLDDNPIGGHTSNPVTADFNKDEIPDLLIGGEDGFLYYKENPRTKK
ncbi:FG-GAP repeat domain-containing protein [Rhodohalobacter sp. 614A]|uniref:FG-GAP repeat domain-containing protein n=1 Tax=Rhodohalobacter sp. 614A TaxID=2908649 RepID=UPI001F3EBEDA|nr:VCBS repeat-containing protein [Rhodohalobacter sp. 614A]